MLDAKEEANKKDDLIKSSWDIINRVCADCLGELKYSDDGTAKICDSCQYDIGTAALY